MSLSDLKHTLRKYEFPMCAQEALKRIEQLLAGRIAPSSKQFSVAMDIISEFIFCEADRRGDRVRGGLSSLQELQLIDILCEYLSSCNNETTKNTIFLSMFGGMESQKRLKILSILASMAVSASSTPVLVAVGVWLQQTGCSSPQSLQLAENLIRDHFYLNTKNQKELRMLANTAPQFISNFITAVTELYLTDLTTKKMPPMNLLEVITFWVYSNPSLCMSAQLKPPPLPSGSIPMSGGAPLAGLVRWCALAPLCITMVDDVEMMDIAVPMKKIKLECDLDRSIVKAVQQKQLSEPELYIKLHLGVLNSLRAGKRTHGPPTAVNAQNLATLVPIIQTYAHDVIKQGYKVINDEKLQECLNRLGQAVQVSLASGCVYGNINNLLASLDTLPENRLLRIVIRAHQSNI